MKNRPRGLLKFKIAAQSPQPRERAILVRAGEPGLADDIGGQNRGKFPGFRHVAPLAHADYHRTIGNVPLLERSNRRQAAPTQGPKQPTNPI